MTQQKLNEAIERIKKTEWCFDTVAAALAKDEAAERRSPLCRAMVRALCRYYESRQWRADFAADEAGLLSNHLNRGVLSQDRVDHFLSDWENAKHPLVVRDLYHKGVFV